MKRMTPPHNAVSEAEVTEEAHLEMRVRVYYWRRFKGLESRSLGGGLSASEESELDELRKRYPDPAKPPRTPEEKLRAIEEYNEKMSAEIRQRVAEKHAAQKSISARDRP